MNVISFDAFWLVLMAWCGSAMVMAVLWALAVRIKNASLVDAGWAVTVGTLAGLYGAAGPGWSVRRAIVAAMMLAWALRLGFHIVRDRLLGSPEDGRYADLRRTWGDRADVRLFWLFQAEAVAAVFFSLPALFSAFNPFSSLTTIEWFAIALWSLSLTGETIADLQLAACKRDPVSRGRTCRVGLWRYSRHPNYFFEWMVWVAYAVFASSSPWGWLAFTCPLAMLYLLFRVTGIPAAEAQAIRTRGDDYRAYQAVTSVFVPWHSRLNAPALADDRAARR